MQCLHLPRPIKEGLKCSVYIYHCLKLLETSLPSLVIINSKTFFLAPNLQTQEGIILRVPRPFPYKDDYFVLWNYDVSMISTRSRQEEVSSINFNFGFVIDF